MSCVNQTSDINQTFIIESGPSNTIFTTGATLIGDIIYFNRTDILSAYTVNLSSLVTNDTYISGITYNNNILSLYRNDGVVLSSLLDTFTGLTINGSLSATTYLGLPKDVYISGGTYSNGTTVFRNTTGGTFSVSGYNTGFTGGTINSLIANTISATTYYNLPKDVYLTSGIFNKNSNSLDLTNNTGGTFTITGMTDVYVTGGTYSNGRVIFRNTTGGTFSVSGFSTGSTIPTLQQVTDQISGNTTTNSIIFTDSFGNTNTIAAGGFEIRGVSGLVTVGTEGNLAVSGIHGDSTIINSDGIYFSNSINNVTLNSQDIIGNYILNLPFKTGGTYTIATIDDIGSSSGLTLQQAIFNGSGSTYQGFNVLEDNSGTGNVARIFPDLIASIGGGINTAGLSSGSLFFSDTVNDITIYPTSGLTTSYQAFLPNKLGTQTFAFLSDLKDTFVSGGTYSNGTAVFTNTTGGTFSVSGFSTSSTIPTLQQVTDQISGNTTTNSIIQKNGNKTIELNGGSLILITDNDLNRGSAFGLGGFDINDLTGLCDASFTVDSSIQYIGFGFIGSGNTLDLKLASDFFMSGSSANTLYIPNKNGTLATIDDIPIYTVPTLDEVLNAGNTSAIQLNIDGGDSRIYLSDGIIRNSSFSGGYVEINSIGYIDLQSQGKNGIISLYSNSNNDYNVVLPEKTSASTQTFAFLSDLKDTFVSGGTYSAGTAVFTNTTGGTFSVSGFSTGSTKDVFVTGGTFNKNTNILSFINNTGGTFTVTGLTDNTVTGVTYNNNILSLINNTGGTVSTSINTFTGLTINGSLSATTYYNLPKDIFVSGGTYSAGTAVFTNTTGGTFSVSGFSTGGTGTDTYVTGGTYSNGTSIFKNNLGNTFSVSGFSTGYTLTSTGITSTLGYTPYNSSNPNGYITGYTDTNVTGGTFNKNTSTLSLTNNTGGTFSVTGLTDINTFVSGGTYSAGTAVFTNTTGGTFSVSGFSTGSTTTWGGITGTLSGQTDLNTALTAKLNSANPSFTGLMTGSGTTLTGNTTTSLVDLSQTWNTTGTPTAFKLNVTNTASNNASLLMDIQLGGASVFKIARNSGLVTVPNSFLAGSIESYFTFNVSGNGGALTITSGSYAYIGIQRAFSSGSGGATLSAFEYTGQINQTGGASGVTRGLYINPTLTSAYDFRALEITGGRIVVPATNIASGTTGAQTINKISGKVNIAAGGSTLVVTNSLVTTSSIVQLQVYGTDVTATSARVTLANGSFTITLNATATSETAVSFIVIN